MINNTTLVGRLTKDVELRYTGNGTAVGNFTMAVERNFKNAQGERETDFINCVIWRQAAETLADFASKGSLIGITGSIQTGSYENNEGRTVYTTDINVNDFQMLEPKSVNEERKNKAQNASGGGYNTNSYGGNQKPAGGNFSTPDTNPFANAEFPNTNDDAAYISDDDYPF